MESQHLLVLDPGGGHELIALARPPADPFCFAEVVAPLGPGRLVEPAGPPLRAPGHVVHRVRGAVAAGAPRVAGELAALVKRAVEQEAGVSVPLQRPAWQRRGWAGQTTAWVEQVLAQRGARRTGVSTVVRSWGLSHVESIPTSEGVRYLKACCPLFAHEPATTAWLADIAPAVVPAVIAVDQERSCLLMEALPPALAASSVEAARVATCSAMAQVQAAAAARGAELREAGAPDRGLAATAAALAEMTERAIPAGRTDARGRELVGGVHRAVGLLEELAGCELPDDALVHGDLHQGNVVHADGGAVVFDWSDACLGHPVLDLAHLCAPRRPAARGVATGALDWDAPWVRAYLRPWRERCTEAALRRALELASIADLAFQAVTYQRIQTSLEPDARQEPTGAALRALGAVVDGLPTR